MFSYFVAYEPFDPGLSVLKDLLKEAALAYRIVRRTDAAELAEKILDSFHHGTFEIKNCGMSRGKLDAFP